jgi:hypothetical protein
MEPIAYNGNLTDQPNIALHIAQDVALLITAFQAPHQPAATNDGIPAFVAVSDEDLLSKVQESPTALTSTYYSLFDPVTAPTSWTGSSNQCHNLLWNDRVAGNIAGPKRPDTPRFSFLNVNGANLNHDTVALRNLI